MMIQFLTNPTPAAVMKLLVRARPVDGDRLVRGLRSDGCFYVWDSGQRGEEIDHRSFADELALDMDDSGADTISV